MSDGQSNPAFKGQHQYTTLNNAAEHIRLLRFCNTPSQRKQISTPLQIELRTWPFSPANPPCYTAISYTWGNPSDTTPILVFEQSLQITVNCQSALLQAWNHDKSAWYWIDSICINQEDDEEKSLQVAMMAKIYSHAQLVLACVGEHANDSQRLWRLMSKEPFIFYTLDKALRRMYPWPYRFKRSLNPLERQIQDLYYRTSRIKSAMDFIFKIWMTVAWKQRFPPPRPDPLLSLLQRPYFQRTWIQQEICSAQKVIICCGKHTFALQELVFLGWALNYAWIDDMNDLHLHERKRKESRSWLTRLFKTKQCPESTKCAYDQWRDSWHMCQFRMSFYMHYLRPYQFTIESSLRWISLSTDSMHLECQDVRDKCFAILELVDWKNQPPIVPDYTKDAFEVAMEIIESIHATGFKHLFWESSVIGTMFELYACWDGVTATATYNMGFVRALDLRRSPQQVTTLYPAPLLSPSGRGLRYHGFHLKATGTGWCLEDCDATVIILQHEQCSVEHLWNLISRPDECIIFPKAAKEGDYCIMPLGHRYEVNHILVIRQSPTSSNYAFVGQALVNLPYYRAWNSGPAAKEHAQNFEVFLTANDLLMLSGFDGLLLQRSCDPMDYTEIFENNVVLAAKLATYMELCLCSNSESFLVTKRDIMDWDHESDSESDSE